MPKKIIQDVVPPEKKSIRNVPVPDRTLRSRFASSRSAGPVIAEHESEAVDEANDFTEPVNTEPIVVAPAAIITPVITKPIQAKPIDEAHFVVTGHMDAYSKKRKIKMIASAVGIAGLFVIGYFVLNSFAHVTVQIVQQTETANLKAGSLQIEYGKDVALARLIHNEYPSSLRVTATEEEMVNVKASGKIIVYNNFSTAPQKLIKETRFEAPNGNMYRIKESITVPGQTTKSGQKVPGSVEVTVYADKEGQSYNIDQVDFTIPGFKNTPQFSGFYARSKTAMSGGFSGIVKKVSEQDKATATAQMKSEIEARMTADIATIVPEGFTYFSALSRTVYSDISQSDVEKDSVQLNMKGVVTAPVFNKLLFAKLIAEHSDKVIPESDVYTIKNPQDLTVSYATEPIFKDAGMISITVEGKPVFVWEVNPLLIQSDLVGIKRSSMSNVFEKYKSIYGATSTVFPMWLSTLPSNKDDITIEFIDKPQVQE